MFHVFIAIVRVPCSYPDSTTYTALVVRFLELLAVLTNFPLLEEHVGKILGNLDQWLVCYKSLFSKL